MFSVKDYVYVAATIVLCVACFYFGYKAGRLSKTVFGGQMPAEMRSE